MWWHAVTHGRGSEWGNWRMEWVASTLHTTSEHGVPSITTADAHTSAASSRLNWRPRRFKRTRPFLPKDEIWFLRVCHHISSAVYQPAHSTSSFTVHILLFNLYAYRFYWSQNLRSVRRPVTPRPQPLNFVNPQLTATCRKRTVKSEFWTLRHKEVLWLRSFQLCL